MPVEIVAELSGNHRGYKNFAIELVHAAAAAGADAIKLQTFKPELLAIDNPKYTTLPNGPWAGRTLIDLYRESYTPWEWHAELFDLAARLNMRAFSSPFHPEAVDFLTSIGCPRFKVASFEVSDEPLLRAIAATRKPVVVSTGVSDFDEIDRALAWLETAPAVTLLHCVSEYPADPRFMNLSRLVDLSGIFDVPVGLSDHSRPPTAAIAAVALGATMLEKHLMMDEADGVDADFSLTPSRFAEMVRAVREAEAACARPPCGSDGIAQASSYAGLRKSLWVVKDVRAGDVVTAENVRALRPGNGMSPGEFPGLIGRRFEKDVSAGEPLAAGMLA